MSPTVPLVTRRGGDAQGKAAVAGRPSTYLRLEAADGEQDDERSRKNQTGG